MKYDCRRCRIAALFLHCVWSDMSDYVQYSTASLAVRCRVRSGRVTGANISRRSDWLGLYMGHAWCRECGDVRVCVCAVCESPPRCRGLFCELRWRRLVTRAVTVVVDVSGRAVVTRWTDSWALSRSPTRRDVPARLPVPRSTRAHSAVARRPAPPDFRQTDTPDLTHTQHRSTCLITATMSLVILSIDNVGMYCLNRTHGPWVPINKICFNPIF